MSEGQGKQQTGFEYLFIAVLAIVSTFLVLWFIQMGRSVLALLGTVGGIGIIVLLVWVIIRTSFRN